jgi:hypothetical protein
MNDRILLSLYYYYNEELHCCGFLTSIVRAVKICLVAVDGNIQAFRIRVRVDGNFRKLVDDFNQDKSDNERVHGNATRRQKLDTKLLATRVDATGNFVRGKDTNADGAQETAHTVHGPDVQSVIEFVPLRNLDATIAKRHAQETNQQRRPGSTKPAAGVIVAKPAMAPTHAPIKVGLPSKSHSIIIHPKSAADAEISELIEA